MHDRKSGANLLLRGFDSVRPGVHLDVQINAAVGDELRCFFLAYELIRRLTDESVF
jgi:hypothetical protein